MSGVAFDGATYIADTSARARSHHPAIRGQWASALRAQQIVTCSITTLELLFATRTAEEFRELEADEATLRDIPSSACSSYRRVIRVGADGRYRTVIGGHADHARGVSPVRRANVS